MHKNDQQVYEEKIPAQCYTLTNHNYSKISPHFSRIGYYEKDKR